MNCVIFTIDKINIFRENVGMNKNFRHFVTGGNLEFDKICNSSSFVYNSANAFKDVNCLSSRSAALRSQWYVINKNA